MYSDAHRYYPEKPLNWFERLIGARYREPRGYKTTWGELYWKLGFALTYSVYEWPSLHIHLLFPSLYVRVPLWVRAPSIGECFVSYGVSWFEGSLHFKWRERSKVLYAPWRMWKFWRETAWDKHGEPIYRYANDFGVHLRNNPNVYKETHPYRYVSLHNGEVQIVNATIWGNEWEWRMPWCPLIRMRRRSIDVEFSDEVGPGRGSWKGGVIGCSWDWKRGLTLHEALREMERTRRF